MKFKVGDKIKANEDSENEYSVTTISMHWEGVVTEVYNNIRWDNHDIEVKTIKCDDKYYVGHEFDVDSKYFDLIEEKHPEVHITVKGNETIAVMKHNSEVKRAVAKCSPDDEFNFEIGAKLALERLFGTKEEKKPLELLTGKKYLLKPYSEVENHCTISEDSWSKIIEKPVEFKRCRGDRYYCETCYLGEWYFSKESFKCEYTEPRMKMVCNITGSDYGKVGVPTKYKDVNGKSLCVGDTVMLINPEGKEEAEVPVVESDTIHSGIKKFIFGIEVSCDGYNINHGWKVRKMRSYAEVKADEIVDGIKYEVVKE